MARSAPRSPEGRDGAPPPSQFIAGVLTQQVERKSDRLEIGIVTHAAYVREAIALLDAPKPVAVAAQPGLAGAVVRAAEPPAG